LSSEATRTVLMIMGMRDNSCRERVSDALGAVKGALSVNVSLIRARAVIEHTAPCEPAQLVWAVVNAGYGAALDGPPRIVA
jgi:copper chaperone CopZ